MPPCMQLRVGETEGKVFHDAAHPEINVPVTVGDGTDEGSLEPQSLDGIILESCVDLDDAGQDDKDHEGKGRLEDNELEQVVVRSGIEHDNGGQESIEGDTNGEPDTMATVWLVFDTAIDEGEDAVDHWDLIQHLEWVEECAMECNRADTDDNNRAKGKKETLLKG